MNKLNHIAFIMDGNGRWATAQNKPRLEGHRQGVKTLENLLPALVEHNIEFATFYAFSSENWKRSEKEVNGLMDLLRWYFNHELNRLIKKDVRVKFIGDRSANGLLAPDVIKIMDAAEEKTAHCKTLTIIFAINYGGRDEILRAAQNFTGKTEEEFTDQLDTAAFPEVDAIVRTGGEQRLSNFLLWQAAYAELFFLDVMWPDFTPAELTKVVESFTQKHRRFGAEKP